MLLIKMCSFTFFFCLGFPCCKVITFSLMFLVCYCFYDLSCCFCLCCYDVIFLLLFDYLFLFLNILVLFLFPVIVCENFEGETVFCSYITYVPSFILVGVIIVVACFIPIPINPFHTKKSAFFFLSFYFVVSLFISPRTICSVAALSQALSLSFLFLILST